MATSISTTESDQYHTLIRDLPQGERPRERLKNYGPRYLSNTELIAILLRTGMQGENVLSVASRVLSRFGGLSGLAKPISRSYARNAGLARPNPLSSWLRWNWAAVSFLNRRRNEPPYLHPRTWQTS